MKRALPYLAAAASGAAMALSLPLVVPFLSIRQVDPAGWLEPVAWVALVPALLALLGAPSARPHSCAVSWRGSPTSTPRSTGSRTR